MKATLPAFALVTLILLGAYHLMRVAATGCVGSGCELYIPLSLLIPLLILGAAVVTSVLAISAAGHERTWLIALAACAAVGVLGPIAALVILRDNPDAFVITSTVLVALVPV